MQTTELKDGRLIVYDDAFLPATVADRYFEDLRDDCHHGKLHVRRTCQTLVERGQRRNVRSVQRVSQEATGPTATSVEQRAQDQKLQNYSDT